MGRRVLEETPGAPLYNMDRPAAEGHGQADVSIVDTSAGSPAVDTQPHGPERLCGMRREKAALLLMTFSSV